MSVDELTERVQFVYREKKRNAVGDIIEGEEKTRCTVWAKVLPLVGKVEDATPERSHVVTYRVTIRFRADIEPDDELIWCGRRLSQQAMGIDVENRRVWWQMECEEKVSER